MKFGCNRYRKPQKPADNIGRFLCYYFSLKLLKYSINSIIRLIPMKITKMMKGIRRP